MFEEFWCIEKCGGDDVLNIVKKVYGDGVDDIIEFFAYYKVRRLDV